MFKLGPSSSSYALPDSYVASKRPAWYLTPLLAVFLDWITQNGESGSRHFRELREKPRDEDAPNRVDVSEARVQRFPALFLLREPPGANVPSPARRGPVLRSSVAARVQAYPVDHAVAVEPVVPPRAEHRFVRRVRAVAKVHAVQPRGQDAVDDEVVERAFAHDGREVAPERGVVAFGRPRGRRGQLSIELFLSSRRLVFIVVVVRRRAIDVGERRG